MCALWNFGLAGWCLYPLARGCRAPRRMTPELAATAPAIPVRRCRLVAGAAELGGSVADRGACNNAVRGIRRVSVWNFGLAGWCLYPLARGCRAPRRMTPELAATAPAIPVWRYRLVAGAAELGGSVADRVFATTR